MNRSDFQALANIRIKEAQVLLQNKCYEGAYYLVGYAVECGLKACIAKRTKRYDFPDRDRASNSYTHNVERLLELSGLKVEHQKGLVTNPSFARNWAIVKDWRESSRYDTEISELAARDLFSAVTTRRSRVMPWLRKWW